MDRARTLSAKHWRSRRPTRPSTRASKLVDLAALPKAELHLHLEGAIRPATVLDLARENDVDFPYRTLEELERALQFDDFLHFLQMFAHVNSTLAKPADFERITAELVEDLAAQNVVYAEIRYAPMHPMRRGMSFDDITAAVLRGAHGGVPISVICGLTRQWDCYEAAQHATRWAGKGIAAIDIGGDEANFPAALFRDIYALAKDAGLQLTAHAGEAAGPDSVWSAIHDLGATRIGHGIRSIEDERLVAYERDNAITLEVCPTSNVKTGVVPDFAAHPLRRLFDAGVPVTLSSDDPAMFGTNISREYEVAAAEFGFSEPELLQLTRNSIQGGFSDAATKQRLLSALP
jgi:adenosine deaminase